MRLSDAEWEVMGPLWKRKRATAREIHADLHAARGWAYTTVKTMLDRLVAKGAVAAVREGRTAVYEPRTTRDAARGAALRSLVENAFDGAFAPLLRFAAERGRLTAADRRALRRLLDDEARRPGAGGAP